MLQAAPAQVLYPTQSTQGNQILPSKGKRQLGNSFSNSLNNFNNKARYGIPYAPNFNYLTVFAPTDDSLLAFKDEALKSDANIEAVNFILLEEFISMFFLIEIYFKGFVRSYYTKPKLSLLYKSGSIFICQQPGL